MAISKKMWKKNCGLKKIWKSERWKLKLIKLSPNIFSTSSTTIFRGHIAPGLTDN